MGSLALFRLMLSFLTMAFVARSEPQAEGEAKSGKYISIERMDQRRLLMRVANEEDLPGAEEELMLDMLESSKWRVDMSAMGAAILVSASMCPHGLGQMPAGLGWRGGGTWRTWPGYYEYHKGSLITGNSVSDWTLIDGTAACEGSPGIKELKRLDVDMNDEKACQAACHKHDGCMAIDYYATTKYCIFYDKPCNNPSKTHDGASSQKRSVRVDMRVALKKANFTFFEAKQWCQQEPKCSGFSYNGDWPDKEREGGVPKEVYFARDWAKRVMTTGILGKVNSYLQRDNPRANCNPEGQQFECPKNPYACLGLSMDADEGAIKQSFRSLSKVLHPDKVKDRTKEAVEQATVEFRKIGEANDVLLDPKTRRETDQLLRVQRKKWEDQRADIKDLYITDPIITTLEPENYPVLIPKGQEWLVHFFLATNDECKKMKVAMALTAAELGIGEDERGLPDYRLPNPVPQLEANAKFRGVVRYSTDALQSSGAAPREGDAHAFFSVESDEKGVLIINGERIDVTISMSQKPEDKMVKRWELKGPSQTYKGAFDKDREWFRGVIVDNSDPQKSVSSFAIRKDLWKATPVQQTVKLGNRDKPRLFGAVNCGRFPDFCKRKGADPQKTKLFPQVRMLFPEDLRYEVFKGRPLGRDLMAFAREATRAQGPVQQFDAPSFRTMQAGHPALWMIHFHWDLSTKAALDCELCRSALPMLKRTSLRLASTGISAGWVNCTDVELDEVCVALGATEDGHADWGALRLVEIGGIEPGQPGPDGVVPLVALDGSKSVPVWDANLVTKSYGQQELLAALESSARMAEFLMPSGAPRIARQAAQEAGQGAAKSEL